MEIRLTHAHRSDRAGRQRAHDALENAHEAVDHAIERFDDARERMVANVKPKLRGWIHAGTAPLALAAGIVLIVLTPAADRWASAVFVASSLVLFGTSAVYHRGTWSPRVGVTLRRLDHANIFLLIAGTYTPLAWMLLDRPTAQLLLAVVWGGAIAGILMRVFWLSAPRWLYVPLYIALGWVAVWFLPAFSAAAGPALVWLISRRAASPCTLGAGPRLRLQAAQPLPRWFRFHEIFPRRHGDRFPAPPRRRLHRRHRLSRLNSHQQRFHASSHPSPTACAERSCGWSPRGDLPQLRTQSRTPSPNCVRRNVPAGGPQERPCPPRSFCVRCCGTDLAAHDPRDRSAHALGAAAATVSPNCVRRIVLRGQLGSRVSPIEPAGSFCVRCCGTELGHGSPREGGGPRPLGAASASPHSGAVQGGVSVDAASASPRSGVLQRSERGRGVSEPSLRRGPEGWPWAWRQPAPAQARSGCEPSRSRLALPAERWE